MPPTVVPRWSSKLANASLGHIPRSVNRNRIMAAAAQDTASPRQDTTSTSGGLPQRKKIKLIAEPLTAEAFEPFGQVVGPSEDGAAFGDDDAKLDLSNGTPRFYIMRLPKRGLRFDRITYHAKVTQCLGGLGDLPWYMAVAAPSIAPKPETEDIRVFKVPPGLFIKMHCGTWHGGPLFDNEQMDFYNLELSDTNVVDHNTHVYSTSDGVEYIIEDPSP